MGQRTSIQWCDDTVNVTSGCDGCELWNEATGEKICYAGNMHETRWAHTLAKTHPQNYSPRFKDVRLIPGRLKKAINWKDLRGIARPDKPWIPAEMPRLIFISDMADALSRDVPFEYLHDEIIEPMNSDGAHRDVADKASEAAGAVRGMAERARHSMAAKPLARRKRDEHKNIMALGESEIGASGTQIRIIRTRRGARELADAIRRHTPSYFGRRKPTERGDGAERV